MSQYNFNISELPGRLELVSKKLRQAAPQHIAGADRMLGVGGKKLRPALVIATAYYCGKRIDDNVINAAAAVELVHLASLVHDDIMDGGTIRHNVPTINAQEGEDSALLTGDYLFAKACALAASVSADAAEIVAETIADLCEGQAAEMKDQFNIGRSEASLILAIEGKTSSLFAVSCILGGMLAGLDEAELNILTNFAENFGIAYQYMDDVNDFVLSTSAAGKSAGNDIREGNYSLPVILSLKGPNRLRLKELIEHNPTSTEIPQLLNKDSSIDQAIEEAKNYRQKAIAELHKLKNAKLAAALEAFCNHMWQ